MLLKQPENTASPAQGQDRAARASVESTGVVPDHAQPLQLMPHIPTAGAVPPEAALAQPLAELPAARPIVDAAADSAQRASVATPDALEDAAPIPSQALPQTTTTAAPELVPTAQPLVPAPETAGANAASEPRVYELPLAVRQTLPPLKLSMHVWNADPAFRFIILDDTRASEGQVAGKGINVIEIRRDGVLLEMNGTRFVLPRGGL